MNRFTGQTARLINSFVWLLILLTLISCQNNLFRDDARVGPWVSDLIQNSPSNTSYPDADIVYLLNESIQEVFDDGSSKNTIHTVFKVLNESGKDYADCEIGYNSRLQNITILYARTITPDGKVISLRKNAIKIVTPYSSYPDYSDYKEMTFSMPGVEVGSVIDYKYVKKEKPTIKGIFTGGFFFQTFEPILHSRYKVIVPKGMEMRYRLLNPLGSATQVPEIYIEDGKKTYLWEYHDIPQIFLEDSMPPLEEIASYVMVTNMGRWEEFFLWWRNEIKDKTAPNDEIKIKVTELTKDLISEEEKMEALFNYVNQDIRYVSINLGKSGYVPESAKEVFENKYGDCKDKSTLLISMLMAAGISANYVLIPTHDRGNLIKDFPYPDQFNHCIVAVKKKDRYKFIDPTSEGYHISYLREDDQNRGVLIFEEKPRFGKTPLLDSDQNGLVS